MEVFKAFTTFSLVDMVSGPLAKMRAGLDATGAAVTGLGTRMGKLALAMAPVAVAAGLVLGGLGTTVKVAADFEQALAGVAARSRAGAEDLAKLGQSARALGASTSFTAVQVVKAQDELVKKGFSVNQIVSAMPGLLSLAAATQSDLALASNVTTAALNSFGLAAERASEIADIMAAASTGSATDINGLAMALQNAGGIVSGLGGDFALLAAMQGKLQDVGINESIAATGIKIMFGRLSAPAGEAAKAIDALGVKTRDAGGNMLPFLQIMKQMEGKLAGMGTAKQAEYIKEIFGQEAMATVMALFKSGTASVEKFAETLRNSAGAAEEMANRQLDTLNGDLVVLGSAWEGVSITVGKLFIPFLRRATQGITRLVTALDSVAQHPVGAFLLKLLAAASAAALGVTVFAAAVWGITKIGPIVYKALLPIKAAILGLGWPMLAVIGVIGLLYAAYRANFGGMADMLDRWYRNISLIFRGVQAVFSSLQGTTGKITGQLAKGLRSAGLISAVTTIGKIIYRLGLVIDGVKVGFQQTGRALYVLFGRPLERIGLAIIACMDKLAGLGGVFSDCFASGGPANAAAWRGLGAAIGVLAASVAGAYTVMVAYRAFMVAVSVATKVWTAAQWLLNASLFGCPLVWIIGLVIALAAAAYLLITHWDEVKAFFIGLWDSIVEGISSAWNSITGSFTELWNSVMEFWDSIDLAECGSRLIDTLIDGIKGAAGGLINSVSEVFGKVRSFLPFSDAQTGPLADLTLSGSRLMSTLAEGAESGAGGLIETINNALAAITPGLALTAPELALAPSGQEGGQGRAGVSYTIHIGNISLPGVKNGETFFQDLLDEIDSMGGGLA